MSPATPWKGNRAQETAISKKSKPTRTRKSSGSATSQPGRAPVVPLTLAHVDAQCAAIEKYNEELESETLRCEQSTAEAIRAAAQPARKLSALDRGIGEWKKAICASAASYYETSFKLGLNNVADLCGESPSDFAHRRTTTILSRFLCVSALDGEQENSNGRVREFIERACGYWWDVPDRDSTPCRLPSWAERRGFGAKIGGWPSLAKNPDGALRFCLSDRSKGG